MALILLPLFAPLCRAQIYITRADLDKVQAYKLDGEINFEISGLRTPWGIAISGTSLFVANSATGTIGKYNTNGSVVNATLISGLSNPRGLAVFGSSLFVANGMGYSIGEYSLDGTPVNASRIRLAEPPIGVAVTATTIFVASQNPGMIGAYNRDGTVINATLVTDVRGNYNVAVAGTRLFVADSVMNRISEYNALTGAVVHPARISPVDGPLGLFVTGSRLYFTATTSGQVGFYNLDGSGTNPSFITGVHGCWGIAVLDGAPAIATQPQMQTATAGGSVVFSVVASGTSPLAYQWRRNGTAIPGATNATLALGNVQSTDAGSYTVVVSNSAGSVTSNAATLTVASAAPTITTHPQGRTVDVGDSVTLAVAATGTAPLAYLWRKDGTAIPGATNSSYVLGNVQAADSGNYTVTVSNSAGSTTSNAAPLLVVAATVPPRITTQPADQRVTAGGTATFSVVATGTAPLAYQWRRDGGNLAGATGATLTLANAPAAAAGAYTVVVSNGAGSVTSAAATLTLTSAGEAPAIVEQPASQTVGLGTNVTLRVGVSGTSPFTYQWRRNGLGLAGATSGTLILPTVAQAAAGSYTVVVANAHGTATSNPAVLEVILAPTITAQPPDHSVAVGTNLAFTVAASGAPPLTYQWSKDGRALAGATDATLALNAVGNADAGVYAVTVGNAAGSVTSRAATLVVSAASSRLANISVRSAAGTGSETLIVGFVVAGPSGVKPVLARGIGPSLSGFGVTGALADPELALYRGSIEIARNNNWGDSPAYDQIVEAARSAGAFAIGARSLDAAVYLGLQPGAYSAQVVARGAGGIALLELYDTDAAATSRLVNVSARSAVGRGEGGLIAGFVVAGNAPRTVLVRGIGPSLAALGIAGALADPQLALFRGIDLVATNDDWWRGGGAQALAPVFAAAGAFTLAGDSRDAAILATLNPGAYTVRLGGADGATGVALIEVYEVP